jgi:hypothetical protein
MISMGATGVLYDPNDYFCTLYLMIGKKRMMGVTRGPTYLVIIN